MTVETPPGKLQKLLHTANWASFAIAVALFLLVGSLAGVRWLGLVSTLYAVLVVVSRRLPYAGSGAEDLGRLTGPSAAILGLLWGAVGLAMLIEPEAMLRFIGWA